MGHRVWRRVHGMVIHLLSVWVWCMGIQNVLQPLSAPSQTGIFPSRPVCCTLEATASLAAQSIAILPDWLVSAPSWAQCAVHRSTKCLPEGLSSGE